MAFLESNVPCFSAHSLISVSESPSSSEAQAPSSDDASIGSVFRAQSDVCLFLEGTWPYVRGGVSTWVDQVIRSMPEIRFSVVYLGSEKAAAGSPKYSPPENLVDFHEIFLFDEDPGESRLKRSRASKRAWKEVHHSLRTWLLPEAPEEEGHPTTGDWESPLFALADIAERASFDDFWNQPATWELLHDFYLRHFPDVPFIEFFWNARFLCQPIWRLLQSMDRIPQAHLYHSVSTGYAGLLGALATRKSREGAFLLSEHGIYVRERIAELLQAEWSAPDHAQSLPDDPEGGGISPLRQLWMDFFLEIGRFSYQSSSAIVSLFHRNAVIQSEFGAPPERIRIIPNGINLDRFAPIRAARQQKRIEFPARKIVGFFGRVVAIKDVKTLLRAARVTVDRDPGARFLLVGPTDEDPGYYAECQRLAKDLGLAQHTHFAGPATPEQALPEFDLVVISSVSEGLPFAILEAFATGIPVVSTDVGACSELVLGRPDDPDAGSPAGEIVPVSDPTALGNALVSLLEDRERQDRYGVTGLERVRALYREETIIAEYRDLYQQLATSTSPTS